MQPDAEVFSVEQVLGVLIRRLPVIGLCVLLAAGLSYIRSKRETKEYAATAAVSFASSSLSQQIAGLPTVSSSNLLAQQSSNLELVKLGDTVAKTAAALGNGLTQKRIGNSLSFAGGAESSVVSVTSTTSSPVLAAKIANTYVRQLVDEQQATNHRYLRSALALVNKQLAAIPSRLQFGPAAVALQNRAQTLRLLDELHYGDSQIAQEASVPSYPSSPRTSRNTLIAAALGLLLGIALAFGLERVDQRIRIPREFEAVYALPLLGAVPKSKALSQRGRAHDGGVALPSSDAEKFRSIRAYLRLLHKGRELRTIVIASAVRGDGRSTLARHLAEAAAVSGVRVILLDADLRNPSLADRFGLQTAPGLADVLIGAVPTDEATHTVELKAAAAPGGPGRTLDLLSAGATLLPNPAELLESDAMVALLEQLRNAYDLIVVDTSALTVVSDAFPLLAAADGTIIVGDVGAGRRASAERLRDILMSSEAPLLGVVANRTKSDRIGARRSVYPTDRTQDIGALHPSDVVAPTRAPAAKTPA
jgi:capsular exopolysaccharide synthesis family protein